MYMYIYIYIEATNQMQLCISPQYPHDIPIFLEQIRRSHPLLEFPWIGDATARCHDMTSLSLYLCMFEVFICSGFVWFVMIIMIIIRVTLEVFEVNEKNIVS